MVKIIAQKTGEKYVEERKIIYDIIDQIGRSEHGGNISIFFGDAGCSIYVDQNTEKETKWIENVHENGKTTYICPECGMTVRDISLYCPYCGEKFKGSMLARI